MSYVGYSAASINAEKPTADYAATRRKAEDEFYAKGAQEQQSREGQVSATTTAQQQTAAEQQAAQTRAYQQQIAADAAAGGDQSRTAKQQQAYVDALRGVASGQQAGAGQLQLKRALESQLAATASQMGSMRGLNTAAAERLKVQQQSQQQQDMAGKSAEVALAEQRQAQELLGGTLSGMRGQDIAAQQAAAGVIAGVRQGDIAASQAYTQAAAEQRSADNRAQAQALGLYDSSGKLDIAATQTYVQQKIAEYEAKVKAGLMSQEQAYKEENFWRDWGADILAKAAGGAAAGAGAAIALSKGGKVKGQAKASGDHEDNDVVPAMLSPGEIVLPRSIALSENAPDKARAFVSALQKSEGKMLSRQSAAKRISELEAELAAIKAMRARQEDV